MPNINDTVTLTRALLKAAGDGNLVKVKKLLEQGAYLHGEDECVSNGTALHYAILHEHLDVAKYLINQGANPHALNYNDEGHLLTAVNCQDLPMIKYLVEEQKLDVNIKSSSGQTLLMAAKNRNNTEILNYITKAIEQSKTNCLTNLFNTPKKTDDLELRNIKTTNKKQTPLHNNQFSKT